MKIPAGLTPSLLLSACVGLSLLLAAITLAMALGQPWIGLKLSAASGSDIMAGNGEVRILDVKEGSPADHAGVTLPGTSWLATVRASGSAIVRIEAGDLLEEPDILPTYAALRAFFDRQDEIARALRDPQVELGVAHGAGWAETYTLRPLSGRPLASLPVEFWMQLGVGLAGFWIGAWIWVLRRREWATRCLVLAGGGLMISSFPAAIYSTRELAIPGELFHLLSALNLIGALTFGVGMIGLFLVYPRKLVPVRWLAVPALVLGTWSAANLLELPEDLGTGRHLPIVLAMLTIITLVAVQFVVTRGNPRDRAALAWLGLAVIVGAGAFVGTVIAPNLLGIEVLVSQGEAFLFFLLIYIGVALGVARYRLFQLDEWAFRILFYVIGVLLLLVIDAVLIMTVVDERAPAFALSLLIVALAWLPLRDMLAHLILQRDRPDRGDLFRQVMDVGLSPPGRDQHDRWRALLEDRFQPLSIAVTHADRVALAEDGMSLLVPGPDGLPAYRLDYGYGGRRLFSPRDAELAADLTAMLANALESRAAYERGVAMERERIARDIHDNIGVQLMSALHSKGSARKDMLIRETLTDLRAIINNASSPGLPFEEMLADLRSQISEHLHALGVEMEWQARSDQPAILPLGAAHTLRSIIREAVQNSLRHGQASRVRIAVSLEDGGVRLEVADDGKGFDVLSVSPGNGLTNMQARLGSLDGWLSIDSGPGGTIVKAHFPIDGCQAESAGGSSPSPVTLSA